MGEASKTNQATEGGGSWQAGTTFWTGQALSLMSTFQEREAQLAQGKAEARRLKANAWIADLQAKDAMARGEAVVSGLRSEGRQIIGRQRASFAGQGISVEGGTAAEIQADTAAQVAADIVTARQNAWREAWGLRLDATDLRSRAASARAASEYKAMATVMGGGLDFFRATSARYVRDNSRLKSAYWDRLSNKG